ncbi:NAD(P)-dependent oxidoreductase [Novosphingobium beihaiensis]|uniref:NAD(P)-dependent oxidoreductase n=1 Tax=Novosphingobium beihaiensis TaxID=2930389 RepID=A0ABT0BJJ3_9SPHN|nr:NAD(P)-dependent oxidoreductase [Novosphingobium beihaiensis]MCJ2185210.1 NAD(P)-dependent oxidoreductase [Novosphingobium beihaiensis]
MKIAVLGASGHAGSEIAREAAARGHDVIAVARHPEKIPEAKGITPVAADATDPVALAGVIAGCDAVISALHFDVPAETLLAALRQAGVPRLLVTGGAASLEIAPGQRLFDSPDFPEEWKPFAQGGITFLDALRPVTDIDWTFFSPAAFFEEGPRTGTFRTGTDQLIANDAGESRISFADYAIAMVDELEAHKHPRTRFTAAY